MSQAISLCKNGKKKKKKKHGRLPIILGQCSIDVLFGWWFLSKYFIMLLLQNSPANRGMIT